mmetsp:Transcript_4920/g.6018  ORF Transcript_4920/g.6018 Transcript_4920/m.6018 type:complete len:313 (+) Transcript_4920:160-1098(+)
MTSLIHLYQKRQLYIHGQDQSEGTWSTNYVLTALLLIGLAVVAYKVKSKGSLLGSGEGLINRLTAFHFLSAHLKFTALSYFFAGLDHHLFPYADCPGKRVVAEESNSTNIVFEEVACPSNAAAHDIVWPIAMFFGALAPFMLIPVIYIMLGKEQNWSTIKKVSLVTGLLAGILAAALPFAVGFYVVGGCQTIAALALLFTAIYAVIKVEASLTNKIYIASAFLTFIGIAIQTALGGACGQGAYERGELSGIEGIENNCPFPDYDGVTGLNHNFVYHILETIAKVILLVPAYHLGVKMTEDNKGAGLNEVEII